VAQVRARVLEQAEGERLAEIAQRTPSGQNINCCVNKGRCFELLIEQHPSAMQGGALIEQLLNEALGPRWICTSLIAAMSLKGGVPQALHQDQGNGLEARNPMLVNALTAITDMNETNGGTLVIPGSHLALSEAVREGKPVGKLPPAINIEAKAGTVLIYDGRLLHGTGINHTDEPRIAMLNGMHKPWLKQQENWMLSVRTEVLRRASPKLLHRMGYQASTGSQTNEGHGFGARGMPGEAAGALVAIRLAADEGRYVRVGELGPDSSEEDLQADYTLRDVVGLPVKAWTRSRNRPSTSRVKDAQNTSPCGFPSGVHRRHSRSQAGLSGAGNGRGQPNKCLVLRITKERELCRNPTTRSPTTRISRAYNSRLMSSQN
jgi:ectoine hydroxylase-related dioxygenase (phytanoyl-CoA dioxygenase family)